MDLYLRKEASEMRDKLGTSLSMVLKLGHFEK